MAFEGSVVSDLWRRILHIMGREKSGRPKDIDDWRRREYLDLERRSPHVPPGHIKDWMLADKFPDEELPVGHYCGEEELLGFTASGSVVFMPDIHYVGDSKYGSCVYADYPFGVYDLDVYGDAKYA
jgi:hypothetical protein